MTYIAVYEGLPVLYSDQSISAGEGKIDSTFTAEIMVMCPNAQCTSRYSTLRHMTICIVLQRASTIRSSTIKLLKSDSRSAGRYAVLSENMPTCRTHCELSDVLRGDIITEMKKMDIFVGDQYQALSAVQEFFHFTTHKLECSQA